MVESRFRLFGYVRRRFVEVLVRKVDQMEDSPISRVGGRPRKTITETIKRNLEFNGLSIDNWAWFMLGHNDVV